MIRLPSPPRKMTAPAPPIDFLNKFNEVIIFQQNLIVSVGTTTNCK